MKKFLFFFSSLLFAQNPICRITEFNNSIKAISFGVFGASVERCVFWINSPNLGQIQIACYVPNNPIPIKNEIVYLLPIGFQSYWAFPDGQMTWIFKPGEFHFSGMGSDGIQIHKDGTL